MTAMAATSDPPRSPDPSRPVQRYERPSLIEYGGIAKLTQSGGSTRREGGVPVMRQK